MRFINYLHYLSLDVVCGAILFQLFWSEILYQNLPPSPQIIALFAAIWLIYLVDRKIDSDLYMSSDVRQQFQYNNRYWIEGLMVILALISIVNIFFLPFQLIQIGFFIAIGICIYWWIWRKGWFNRIFGSKELFTAFFYTLGIGAVSLHQAELNEVFFEFFGLLYLCAFQNLILFSSIEKPDAFLAKYYLLAIEIFFVLFVLTLIYADPRLETFHLLTPFLVTFCLQSWIHYFAYSIQQRFLGELAFLSPIIYFIYEFFSK